MKTAPILFNTEMVQAIQEGRKTVTRRIIKPLCNPDPRTDGLPAEKFDFFVSHKTGFLYWQDLQRQVTTDGKLIRAPYMPGDILWVRETWSTTEKCGLYPNWPTSGVHYMHKAIDPDCEPAQEARWFPSIHMPKEAARIFLRVKDVRVERLQDMRLEDCLAEGVRLTAGVENDLVRAPIRAREWFSQVWDRTIKPADHDMYGWAANPWVWVIEFERCDRPEGWR